MLLPFLKRRNAPLLKVPGTSLYMRFPVRSDMRKWLALRFESQDFLRPWEPKWPDDDLSPAGFYRRLRSYSRQAQDGGAKTFFLFDGKTDDLLGGLSLTRINRKANGSAMLGYWMGERHAGKGHMRKAVPELLKYAIDQQGLDLVEAACLPENERSLRLLVGLGFERCHIVPRFLEINGTMEDHVLLRIGMKEQHIQADKESQKAGKFPVPMV